MFEGIRFDKLVMEYEVFSGGAGGDLSLWASRSFPDPYDRRAVL